MGITLKTKYSGTLIFAKVGNSDLVLWEPVRIFVRHIAKKFNGLGSIKIKIWLQIVGQIDHHHVSLTASRFNKNHKCFSFIKPSFEYQSTDSIS